MITFRAIYLLHWPFFGICYVYRFVSFLMTSRKLVCFTDVSEEPATPLSIKEHPLYLRSPEMDCPYTLKFSLHIYNFVSFRFVVLLSSTYLFTVGVEVVYFHLITLRHTHHSR
jgi:hypothetical protein